MDFTKSHFYNMKSKSKLLQCLYLDDSSFHNILNQYRVYISIKDGKTRLVEEPLGELKRVQKRIKQLLDKNISNYLPEYILCKKNSSWVDVSKKHMNSTTVIAFDISKFFPSIDYSQIVKLFTKHFKTSTTVAKMLTSLLCIDHNNVKISEKVNEWICDVNSKRKRKLPYCHLSTGSSASVIVAELVAYDMFEEVKCVCKKQHFVFTAYMDDLHISSSSKISKIYSKKIINIIRKYGYEVNEKKMRVYLPEHDAIITGVVKKKNSQGMTIKYSMEKKLRDLIDAGITKENKNKIISLLNTIRQIDEKKYFYYKKIIDNC